MALPTPPTNTVPIPNNPFYSPESNFIRGEYSPFILGAGFLVNNETGVIEVPGGGGVTTVVGGLGISVSPTAGNVIVTNTGVRTLTAGAGITLTGTAQDITIASSGGASGVTSITAGTGLTGGTITASGTINLANTIVAPGSYTYGSFTVDQQGRLTAASSGVAPVTAVTGNSPISVTAGTTPVISVGAAAVGTSGVVALNNSLTSTSTTEALTAAQGNALANQIAALPPNPIVSVSAPVTLTGTALAPNIGISSASTTGAGAVQLHDGLTCDSTTLALTANMGCCLQGQIQGLLLTPGIDLAGTIDASTGLVSSVTSVGTAQGYNVGFPLPTADATTNNSYVIATVPGTMTPPGGSSISVAQGDWLLASEVSTGIYSWQLLNVGFDAPAASTSVQGIVCLSTNALAQAGTDITTALTPAAAASAYVPLATYAAKGDLLAATAASTPVALPVGSNGQVLVACSTTATGLCWVSINVPTVATPTVLGTVLGCTTASNTGLGCNALLGNLSSGNTAVGLSALGAGTSGDNNTAVGACALSANTGGVNNVGLGSFALTSNTTGNYNVAVGRNSLFGVTTGFCNTSIGFNSACSLTTGCFNVAAGSCALNNAASSIRNVAVGACALQGTTGSNNAALGAAALQSNVGGSSNIAVGFTSGCNLTSGDRNIAIGPNTTFASATGSCQLVIGYDTGCYWLQGDSNKNIRPGAGIIDCTGSVGTCGQIMCSTGTALRWSDVGKTASGIVSTVNVPNQCVCIDDLQFGMYDGCKSFVMRLAPGCAAITTTWTSCHTPDTSGTALLTRTVQDWALTGWRYLWFDLNFGAHGKTQSATICVRPASGPTRMYQFIGMVGASYCCNPISVTRIL